MALDDRLVARLRARVQSYREDMVEFQRDLTALVALGPENDGEGEWSRALFLTQYAQGLGFRDIERVDAPDARVPSFVRPNLVVRIRGGDGPPLVVLSHTDTVPPGDLQAWTGDPYSARLEGDRLLGRGVEDNQQGLTTSLFGARALLDEDLTPPGDVVLLMVADEETGNEYGVEFVLEQRPDLIPDRALVVVPDFGLPDGLGIEVAEKSGLVAEFVVRGRQVHASMPDAGLNAHRVSADLVMRLDRALANEFPDTDPTFDPRRSTFEPTKRSANVPNVNTIPGEERFFYDCRVLPHYPLGEVQAVMRAVADEVEDAYGATIEIAYPRAAQAAPATPADAPVVRSLRRAISQVKGRGAHLLGIGGGTVASSFRHRGIPAAVWGTMDDTAHQPDEYCLVSNLVGDATVFAVAYMLER